jgi:serine/threonine-protein kinase
MVEDPNRLKAALADRYTLIRPIGRGGMATVYLAQDLKHQRQVAIKVLRPEVAAAVGVDRFLREIEIGGGLTHPHILPLYDSGEAQGFLYYVMPYIDGESLRDRLDRETQLALQDALHVAREVADGLSHAHSQGVVHRDIKPENILLSGGHAVIADFGIARAIKVAVADRLTQPGFPVGTPAYMSPEQASGEETLDGRTDVYALGCVLYEMLVGEPPYTGPTQQVIIAKRFSDPVPSVRRLRAPVPVALDAAITRALSKMPADRYPTMDLFWEALGSQSVKMAISGTSTPPSIGINAPWFDPDVTAPVPRMLSPHVAPGRRTIAVLPFTNMSADEENEYFSDGITEEIINALTRIPTLGVAARTSSFAFKGRDIDVRDVGRQLNVGAVLEGSVRRAGKRIRITAQLVDVSSGYHLWSERFDREMEDVFAIQDEIARSIVDQLRVELADRPADAAMVKPRTTSLEAYNLYLKGRYFWVQREGGLYRGLECFRQALEKDPDYGPAYAGTADCYNLLGFYGFSAPKDVFPEAKAAAMRALQIDDTLAEAHASLAFATTVFDWAWQDAERGFARAIDLNPGYATAHHWYAEYLMAMGRLAEALAEARRAQELDPLGLIINTLVAMIHYLAREYEQATIEGQKVLEMDPDFLPVFIWLGQAYQQRGMYREALDLLERGCELSSRRPWMLALLAQVWGAAGEREGAEEVLRELRAASADRYVSAFDYARIYLGSGERARAIEQLKAAYEERSVWLTWIGVDPAFDALRSEPGFDALVRRMKFPAAHGEGAT